MIRAGSLFFSFFFVDDDVDAEVLGWLSEAKSLSVRYDWFRRCAANAITAPLLIEHAERIERSGDSGSKWAAGLMFVCAMLTWALVAPVLFLACRAALHPVFTRVVAKLEPPAEDKQAP